jgi:hypothetical protein
LQRQSADFAFLRRTNVLIIGGSRGSNPLHGIWGPGADCGVQSLKKMARQTARAPGRASENGTCTAAVDLAFLFTVLGYANKLWVVGGLAVHGAKPFAIAAWRLAGDPEKMAVELGN